MEAVLGPAVGEQGEATMVHFSLLIAAVFYLR